ncbi:MAG: aldehyde dehydrogenase family protein [Synergistaceae bacterium]|jgi:succinate-semialdehyde dehydrogenase|nr:aldehyde dehydrogenase family protein [Synergistaceae bacterium]
MAQETISEMIEKSRKAQEIFAAFTQEQVDKIVLAVCETVYKNREALSREAVEETALGTYENKVFKHANVILACANFLKGKRSVGLLEDDKESGVMTFAKPMGVVGCVTPSTGPTATAVVNVAHALKGGNSIIVAPHPRAKKVSARCARLMREAIRSNGGPENLVQCIAEPTLQSTDELMKGADVVVATGGGAMVKAAYSSGRPSFGVGPGNVQTLFTEDFTDYDTAAQAIVKDRAYDNGILCTGEQALYLPKKTAPSILEAFQRAQGHILTDRGVVDRLRGQIFPNGAFLPSAAGLSATRIAEKFGLPNVPADTKVLMAECFKYGKEEPLCQEVLFPFIRFFIYESFEDALHMAKNNLLMMGAGHTASIFSNDDAKIKRTGEELPVGRVMVNQATAASAGNTVNNGLEPTMSLGCGTWGNNSVSENLVYKHLINKTRVAYFLKDKKPLDPAEVFGS